MENKTNNYLLGTLLLVSTFYGARFAFFKINPFNIVEKKITQKQVIYNIDFDGDGSPDYFVKIKYKLNDDNEFEEISHQEGKLEKLTQVKK